MPVSSRHVELALYADDAVIIVTSRKPAQKHTSATYSHG
jgi:hypothetical protein